MVAVSYLVLHTEDLQKTVYFYGRVLEAAFTKEKHVNGPEHYSCHLQNMLFEIYPARKKIRGGVIVGFAVGNLEALLARIGESSARIHLAETCRYAVLKDPDQRIVHLVEKGRNRARK